MTSRRLLTLSIVALVVIAAAVWLAGRQGSSGPLAGQERLYPELKGRLGAVEAIHIYKAGDARSVELVRKDSGWTVAQREGHPAEEPKVRKLLLALSDAKIQEEKTSNPQQYVSLNVQDTKDPQATGVRIDLIGLDKPISLIVGKQGTSGRSHYVRRAGEPQSWLIDTTIDTSATADAWLRREIIDVSAGRVQSATVSVGKEKPYTAAKKSRADENFSVENLPKGKQLSAPSIANSFATALTALTLSEVQAKQSFGSAPPDARTTFKTFDGLVVDLDGWVKDQKRYVAVRTSFDAAQAERFKVAAAPAEEKPAEEKKNDSAPADAKAEEQSKPEQPKEPAPNVAEEAQKTAAKLAGWVYEIPEYKYEILFKPLDQLL